MKTIFAALIAVTGTLLSACVPASNTRTGTAAITTTGETERVEARSAPTLEGTSWSLVLIGSRAAAWPSTIAFGKDDYEGRSACNGHGGTYTQDGPRLTFNRGMSTMAACDGTLEEQALFRALGETDHVGFDDKRLFLIDKRGVMLAMFSRSNG